MTVPKNDGTYVAVHCEGARAGSVVPSKIDAIKLLAGAILREFVIFLKDGRKIIGMLFSNIFYAKIIH